MYYSNFYYLKYSSLSNPLKLETRRICENVELEQAVHGSNMIFQFEDDEEYLKKHHPLTLN